MTQPLIEEVFLACDPSAAFDLLADARNETRWSKSVSLAEMRSDGPVGQGSRFVTVYRGQEYESTLMEYARPERLTITSTGNLMAIDTAYTFTEANEGTRLVVSTALRPKRFLSVLSPLLRLLMQREVAKKYAAVKMACETPADSSSG